MIKYWKENMLMNIKKTKWLLEKIEEMIQKEEYCSNIVQQTNSAIGMIKKVNDLLLENHLKCCWIKELSSNNEKDIDSFVKELIKIWDISTRK